MAEYPGLKCPRLTPEELSRSVDRLSRTPKKDVKELVQERRTLGGDQLEAFFERNYSRSVGRMRKAREDNVKEINESLMRASPIGHPLSPKRKAMSDDVSGKEEQYIERMYLMPMRKKETILESLDRKYLSPMGDTSKKGRSSEEIEETAERLFRRYPAHKRAILEAAEIRVYGKPDAARKLNAEQLAASVDNLYAKAQERRAQLVAKIDEEYPPERAEVKKMTAAELAAVSDRLAAAKT
jgi:hypothetical protein|mmetsp:Transcript_1274/g.2271  ORF Transcript_1274/g.2271 Transcript_1274/m.2271 type:complete len:240 (-) Transcript_1274:82-801(-)|eukprot:CAMPEP_0174287924 /NCGR_PEP_ID=MMETSP0809-20121228/18424_1 /TAXON_ID=73025 ORGANISM="Eutreptiella gymnastica-like, Strain CCMP1594" /NCGR_SAMPLE_ID=MMETSP0809 /ASSEMBLY_ACC=CAM_ASM_000658 /LENGTH=239 /DNA_ID=CAMNT_0015384785 /DNA_START=39 /DNA_END=758 /DNA_ORIENTATION=+